MRLLWTFLLSLFRTRANLLLENTLLRQQLVIYQRSVKRPKIKPVLGGLHHVYTRVA